VNDEEWAVHDALFGAHPDASDSARNADGAIANAWSRVVWDCGCPDIYYCPMADEVECPRHSSLGACCDRAEDQVAARG
jgi:hypothetical protein